jgi:hypothetical protein
MHFFLEMMKKILPEGWFPASEAESKALHAEPQKELPQPSPLAPLPLGDGNLFRGMSKRLPIVTAQGGNSTRMTNIYAIVFLTVPS